MLGEGGADPGPGGGDRRRPAPGGVDAQPKLSGAAGDARGNVQDPVAERFDLAALAIITIQIILGKVRPRSRHPTEAHPQVLIIAPHGAQRPNTSKCVPVCITNIQ